MPRGISETFVRRHDHQHANTFRRAPAPRGLRATSALLLLVFLPATVSLSVPHCAADDYPAALAQARSLARGGDMAAAARAFGQAAALGTPEEAAQAWFELSVYLERSGDHHGAAAAIQRVTSMPQATPWHIPAYERAARLYQSAGRVDRAVAAYEALLALPGVPPETIQQALVGQMRLLQEAGDPEGAARAAHRLLADHPAGPYAAHAAGTLADLHLSRGEHDAARRVAEAEARREGGDAGLLLRVASRLADAGALEPALRLLEQYANLRPEDRAGLQILHDLHRRVGTLPAYEAALAEQAKDPQRRLGALRRLADLYARERVPEKEREVLEQVANLLPEDPEARAQAARAALRAGDTSRALQHFRRALDLAPESARLRFELGEVHARRGERDLAVEAWKQATAYDPADLNSAQSLGYTLRNQGYYHEAVQVYTEARAASGDPAALAPELGEAYEALLWLDRAVAQYLLALRSGTDPAGQAERRLRLLAEDPAAREELVPLLERARRDGDAPEAALVALGIAHLQEGNPDTAREVFAGLPGPGRHAGVLVETALSLEHRGDTRGAAALYEAALEGGLPGHAASHATLRLAALHREKGRWRSALAALEGAVTRHAAEGTTLEAHLALADILARYAGRPAEAADIYARVIREAEGTPAAIHAAWGLADCAFFLGDHDRAAEEYRRLAAEAAGHGQDAEPVPGIYAVHDMRIMLPGAAALPARPTGPVYAAFQLAEIAFRGGKLREAREQFERLAREHPDSIHANDALERVLLISSRFTGRSPSEPRFLEALGLLDRGEFERAARLLESITSLGPDEPLADVAALAHADGLHRYGDAQEAAQAYERIPEGFPGSPLAAEALLRAGQAAALAKDGADRALALYRRVMLQYPDSPQAHEAEVAVGNLLLRR